MAAKTIEDPKKTEAAADETAKAEGAPAKAKGGLMGTLLSAAIPAVVLGAIGFGLAYFVVPMRMQASAAAASGAAPAAAAAPAASSAPAPVAPDPKEKTARSAAEVAATGGKTVTKFTIEEITVNIADTKGNRFVRAGVYFEAEPAVLEELEANRARMVDTLGQVLSTKTLDDLTSPNIRGNLRLELMSVINPTLKAGHVDNLYFTDLLVQ